MTAGFCFFVSPQNSQLKRSSHNLTLPAVHFCPITSPHLAQQGSACHENIAFFFFFVSCCFSLFFFLCREPLCKWMRNKAPSYPSAQCASVGAVLSQHDNNRSTCCSLPQNRKQDTYFCNPGWTFWCEASFPRITSSNKKTNNKNHWKASGQFAY